MKNLLTVLLFINCFALHAADVVAVLPLTDRILMVQFDEGYAVYHKSGQKRSDESMVVDPLDVTKATALTAYSLSSGDDANYSAAKNPTDIGRKAKGTSFAHLCQGWGGAAVGCVNSSIDHAKEHWVYLFLPTALQSGKRYTLTLSNLAKNSNTFSFTFSATALRSEAIHVNNIGYSTAAKAKYGYLYHWLGDKGSLDLKAFDGKPFNLYNTVTKTVVFAGTIAFRKAKNNVETNQSNETPNNNFSNADVYECDFSAFNTPGEYILLVEGMGSSFPFKIGADVFREPYFWTMKGLYHNRSGIELLAKHTDWPRPAPHNPKLTPNFANKLKYTTTRFFDLTDADASSNDKAKIEAGFKGNLTDTYGWYQDAGDWDGYYMHSNIPSELMFLYELARNKFTDNELNIPESGNGLPDVLDEAAWLLRFYKRLKDETKSKGWGTGGVGGARVMGDLWGGDTDANELAQGSWQDKRDWYVSGEDPWMTYKYAAMAAQFYYILATEKRTDTEGVNWLKEAVDAYNWAKSNTKPTDENKKFTFLLKDMRAYAAVALYRATGEKKYNDQFVADANTEFSGSSLDFNRKDLCYAAFIYTLMPKNRTTTATLLNNVINGISILADNEVVSSSESRACRWGGNTFFPMLVGQPTTPMVQIGAIAQLVNRANNPSKSDTYLKYMHTTSDYFLGCNPLNTTWITGVGDRHPLQPFHMDWFYSTNPNKVIKGIVPYGPWRTEGFQQQNKGPWFDSWSHRTVYPTNIADWPGHERWFDSRYGLLSSEFTVHQNNVVAAFVYGFLTEDKEQKTIIELSAVSNDEIIDVSENITVFPNPANTNVTITLNMKNKSITSIDLINISGSLINNMQFKSSQDSVNVNLMNVPKGVYFLDIKLQSGEKALKKITVQ